MRKMENQVRTACGFLYTRAALLGIGYYVI